MSDYVGGCLFFEPNQTREKLITATLEAMELLPDSYDVRLPDEDGFPRFFDEGLPLRQEATPEQSLAALRHLETGFIENTKPGPEELFWFEPNVGSYPVMTIWITDRAMFYDEMPEYSEAFVKRWFALCEQSQVAFGYFGPFEHMLERATLEKRFLPLLQSSSVAQLLAPSDVYWLAYLGPEFARKWRQQQMPLPATVHPLISQELPSGAHFLRFTTSVFGN